MRAHRMRDPVKTPISREAQTDCVPQDEKRSKFEIVSLSGGIQ